ncbi:MAG: MBL fold metallo-hydrolase [Proteobacteria bacterium]|nr:MBL fold metallo-hydrolase [Pseudomonadota bacterium]
MKIIQIKLRAMDTFCYVVGDEASKKCALIDPAFETARILNSVKEEGYTVAEVVNTHNHSDHSAGNAAVIAATGARLSIHESDAPGLVKIRNKIFAKALGGKSSPKADVLLQHGDSIAIGETVLKVIHTPGHTPGCICLHLEGSVFTGDTLFVGAVGRTDLPGGSHRQLLKSIHERLYSLPEETRVWPGHDYGIRPSSTIGLEIETNPFTLEIP